MLAPASIVANNGKPISASRRGRIAIWRQERRPPPRLAQIMALIGRRLAAGAVTLTSGGAVVAAAAPDRPRRRLAALARGVLLNQARALPPPPPFCAFSQGARRRHSHSHTHTLAHITLAVRELPSRIDRRALLMLRSLSRAERAIGAAHPCAAAAATAAKHRNRPTLGR